MSHGTAGVPAKAAGWYRWGICALLILATALNYIDRQTIGFLKPVLSHQYGWNQDDYAFVVRGFLIAYAVGYVFFGRLIDTIGTRRGYTVAVAIWTAAHIASALLGLLPPSVMLVSFMLMQFVLGIGQSGNFPAALKAVAEWFPQKERALANGVFNAGSSAGAIMAPLIVPAITLAFGWQWAFVATGALSLLWLAVWLPVYGLPGESRRLSQAEREYIESDPYVPVKQLAWLKVMAVKETWAFALGKFITDPVWFFYLFWLPPYFMETYKDRISDISGVALPIIAIYFISDFGSVLGGWMSSAMMKRGASANRARKLTMTICALCVLPAALVTSLTHDLVVTTIVIGIAAAAHQAFSANLLTLPSDLMPKTAVGSCSGIGGTMGAIGSAIMTFGVAKALSGLGGYSSVFVVASVMYFLATLSIHLLSPRLAPARFTPQTA